MSYHSGDVPYPCNRVTASGPVCSIGKCYAFAFGRMNTHQGYEQSKLYALRFERANTGLLAVLLTFSTTLADHKCVMHMYAIASCTYYTGMNNTNLVS